MNVFSNLKNILESFLVMIVFVGLTACSLSGPKGMNHSIKLNEFQTGNKAIVITKVKNKDRCWFGEERAFYTFSRVDANYENKEKRHCYRVNVACIGFNSEYDILMIEPGTYALEKITYGHDAVYSSRLDGFLPGKKQFSYGSFSVNPHEIIYLGNIEVDPDNVKTHISVANDYEKALNYFYKKYPALSNCPVKVHLLTPAMNPSAVTSFDVRVITPAHLYVPPVH